MYLIKIGCLLAAFFSLPPSLFSQDTTALILRDIRNKCREINAGKHTYRKVGVDPSGETSEGGEATGYFYKDGIVLIEERMYWESGKSQRSIYYNNGAPVFIFLKESTYNVPFYVATFNSKLTKVTEDRSYFYKGKMIRWIDAGKKVFSARDNMYTEKEARALSLAKELYDKVLAADTSKKASPPDKHRTK
ncbi:hypothetical protein [Chitinophaga sp. RAB17]|uniref:hypothetical protein n=1 Tax=Chitinophaga sp. RAB17 TaxID=3233049 RepID=UPI003F8FEB23